MASGEVMHLFVNFVAVQLVPQAVTYLLTLQIFTGVSLFLTLSLTVLPIGNFSS